MTISTSNYNYNDYDIKGYDLDAVIKKIKDSSAEGKKIALFIRRVHSENSPKRKGFVCFSLELKNPNINSQDEKFLLQMENLFDEVIVDKSLISEDKSHDPLGKSLSSQQLTYLLKPENKERLIAVDSQKIDSLTMLKGQLQQEIKNDEVEIYKLLGSGNIETISDEDSLLSQEIYLCAQEPEKILEKFPCTHSFLEKHWVAEDDEFVFSKGYCIFSLEEDATILLQRGMLRFGCRAGISIDMLTEFLQNQSNVLNPIQIEVECMPDTPDKKAISHIATYPLDLLDKLANVLICPGELEVLPEDLDAIKKSLKELDPLLKRARLESIKPYICKECKGYKNEKTVKQINSLREQAHPIYSCPGCSKQIFLTGGCSVVTCIVQKGEDNDMAGGCVSATKTCVYCLDGSTGLMHSSIGDCTEKLRKCIDNKLPLPLIMECKCLAQSAGTEKKSSISRA